MPESPRELRLGVCGPVGTGKSSLIMLLCAHLGDELRDRGRHQRHLHRRGRPDDPGRGRARPRADRRGRDRSVPAHRHPRRHHRQPAGRRGPRRRPRAAGPGAGRVGRRQPHRDLLARARRRPDLRDRRRRRWRRGPQGRPGHRACRPAGGQQDRPRAPRRGRRRPDALGRPSPPATAGRSSRSRGTTPTRSTQLLDWVRAMVARQRTGDLVPADPGPMAPHVHAEGSPHSHGDHVHAH